MENLARTVRIFISSTFKDMHSERDYLVNVIFPRLREFCHKKGLELVDVDLRWGIYQEKKQHKYGRYALVPSVLLNISFQKDPMMPGK